MQVVILGGNGYLGHNLIQRWLKQDPQVTFTVLGRASQADFTEKRVNHVQADATDHAQLKTAMPSSVDIIIDLIGRPEKDPKTFDQVNTIPAYNMLQLAQEFKIPTMGFVIGKLGPKAFIKGKQAILDHLKASGIRTEAVAPTLVYGNGRQDSMTKLVPLLKFFGLFSANLKPVHVDQVTQELIDKLTHEN